MVLGGVWQIELGEGFKYMEGREDMFLAIAVLFTNIMGDPGLTCSADSVHSCAVLRQTSFCFMTLAFSAKMAEKARK